MLKLSADIVNAFVEPCIKIIEQIIPKSGRLELGEVYIEESKISPFEVSISSMVSGDLEGKVVLSLSTDTALEMAEQMMGSMVDSLDSDAQSAISELMTMIVGNASAELSKIKHNIKMAPVSFSYGAREPIGSHECPYPVTVPIKSNLGTFELDLAFY